MYEQFVRKRQLRIINCECVLTSRDGNGGSTEASVRWDSDQLLLRLRLHPVGRDSLCSEGLVLDRTVSFNSDSFLPVILVVGYF